MRFISTSWESKNDFDKGSKCMCCNQCWSCSDWHYQQTIQTLLKLQTQ